MKIISNNCAAAYYYKMKNLQYDHPFMWSLIDSYDFISLIQEYDNINFDNYKMFELTKNPFQQFMEIDKKIANNRKIYGLNIDKKLNVYYTHFLYDITKKTPTNIGPDKFYYKNDEYVVSFYKKYCKCNNETPVFLIVGYEHNNWSEQKANQLVELNSKYKIILISKWKVNNNDTNKLNIIDNLKFGFPNSGKLIEKHIKEIDSFLIK